MTFAASPSTLISTPAGNGGLTVDCVRGQSVAVDFWSTSPLKLLVPKPRGSSVWAYTATLGGGAVAGDSITLDLLVKAQARCLLSSQSATKVYRNPRNLPCRQTVTARIRTGALLVHTPDPVQCFAGSTWRQDQQFFLEPGAGLVLLDWVSGGRTARGERWSFNRYSSRTRVHRAPPTPPDPTDPRVPDPSRPAEAAAVAESVPDLIESILLRNEPGGVDLRDRLGRMNCLATLLVLGELLRDQAAHLLAAISAQPLAHRPGLLSSASATSLGTLVRFAGTDVQHVARALNRHLQFLKPLLGDDPAARKW